MQSATPKHRGIGAPPIRLGINIDHIATLRNARGGRHPDPLRAAELAVEAGADNTFAQNDLSLQVKMTDVLALAVGFSVRHNTDPPVGFEETDTLTTVNLVYEIK